VTNESKSKIRASLPWLLALCLGVVVANRPDHVGADTETYIRYFYEVRNGFFTIDDFARIEPGFYWFTYLIAHLTDSPAVYFFIIFVFQFVGIATAFGKQAENFSTWLYLPLVWLSYPFFYSLSLNVLRQGMAFVFVIYALDQRICGNRLAAYALVFVATAFHQASILFLFPLLVLDIRLATRWLIAAWFLFAAASAFGALPAFIDALLRGAISMGIGSHFFSYADSDAYGYETGLRLQFLLFSSTPVVLYWFLRRHGLTLNRESMITFQFYLSINILYFLAVGFAYSDRVALLSWLLLPFLVSIYSLDEKTRKRLLRTRAWATVMCFLLVLAPSVFCYFYFFRDHLPSL
jgi:EpsG family